ncbi:hypothetical protein BGX33_002449 [Mortierella sp. NVP41]|nr:hypothetical protein BGX33_002449 [Mortierella sp. NVP41]
MTSNFNSPWTKVFELPELLTPIGSFLDPPDLLSCVQICRHWNQLFIPALWRTINDRLYSWPKIIEDLSVNPQDEGIKDETWFRDIYSKYGHHIRFLCADSAITILAAQVSGQCVNLRTLSVSRIGSKHFVEEARTLVERIQGKNASLLENEKKDGLSKNLISPLFSESIQLPFGLQALETCQRWIFTQRFWLLVSQNPLLQGLQLGSTLQGPCVPLESELIYRILASLPLLTTFECDMSQKVFDLQLILENIPQVRHFASSIRPPGRPALTKSFPQIQTLYLNLAFAIPDFFSLLIRLPNLEVLRIKALCYVDFFAGVPETLMDNTPSSLRELHFFDTNPAVIKYLDRALADLVLP